jgi:hypothetical protein
VLLELLGLVGAVRLVLIGDVLVRVALRAWAESAIFVLTTLVLVLTVDVLAAALVGGDVGVTATLIGACLVGLQLVALLFLENLALERDHLFYKIVRRGL